MTKIELKDLMVAVLASRQEVDPDLEIELLEAIVKVEAQAAGDVNAAMVAIDTAITAAIARGVGYLPEVEASTTGDADDDDGADHDNEGKP
jgi:hypothetical protein